MESSREQLFESLNAVINKKWLCVQQGSDVKSDLARFRALDPQLSMINPAGGLADTNTNSFVGFANVIATPIRSAWAAEVISG